MEQKNNNMATASMVLGILSIVCACCCCMGVILGGLAVLFACLSKVDVTYTGTAKVGLITGIVGIVLGVLLMIAWCILMTSAGEGDGVLGEIYGRIPEIRLWLRGGRV